MDSLFGDDDIDLKDEIEEIEGDMPAGMQEEGNDTSPRETADLFGHGDIEAALLEDFHAHRLPHAFILAGPEGIGKATLAYRLARFLFAQSQQAAGLFGEDEKPATLHIAPDHPVFRRVASGGHADLMVVEREFDEKKGKLKKNISAELARSIAPFLRKTAAELIRMLPADKGQVGAFNDKIQFSGRFTSDRDAPEDTSIQFIVKLRHLG